MKRSMIEELQRFIEVVGSGNITHTAEKLHLTQSALSQSIHRLEKELGTKLFILKGKHLELTAEGNSIAEIARRITALWEKAKNQKTLLSSPATYTIGAYDNAAIRLGHFFKKNLENNKYTLELMIDSSTNIMKLLTLGILDIAICVDSLSNTVPTNIVALKTFEEKFIPVTTKIYKGPISKIPFIFYKRPSNTRQQFDRVFTEAGITPTIYAESTSTTFMKELAILGCGVALLPENIVRQELKSKKLLVQPLKLKFQRRYSIYTHKNQQLPEKILKSILNYLM